MCATLEEITARVDAVVETVVEDTFGEYGVHTPPCVTSLERKIQTTLSSTFSGREFLVGVWRCSNEKGYMRPRKIYGLLVEVVPNTDEEKMSFELCEDIFRVFCGRLTLMNFIDPPRHWTMARLPLNESSDSF